MRRKIMLLLGLFLILSIGTFSVYAWWNCEWKYRVPITLRENSGTDLTDFQVLITVDTQSLISSGKMRSDCGDIRFTYYDGSSEVEIPYWIESGCNSPSTKIWIKVPNIPASGTVTIYMYYGNPSATSKSSGDQVFELFDDFEDGVIDSSKWNVVGGATESSGVLRGEGGNQRVWVCSKQSFNAPIIIEYRMRPESTGDFDSGIRVGNLYFISDTGSYGAPPNICTSWCYPSGSQGSDTNFHIYKAIIQATSQQLIDLTSGGSRSASYSYSPGYLCLIGDSDSSSRDTLYDWIRVRKYASSEPSYTIGSEEESGLLDASILEPNDGMTAKSDIVTIKAAGTFGASECSTTLTGEVVITSPVSKTYSMTCSGSTCSISLDLNDVLAGVGIESNALPVSYYVELRDQHGTVKNSPSRTFYVRTSHNVTILEPTEGSIVLGTGFVVKARSDSLLKIYDCSINLPAGATVSRKIVSPEDRYCEIWVDLTNYCGSNTITFSVNMTNNASVTSTSESRTHTIYDPQIVVDFVSPTPPDGSTLDKRYLPIRVEVNKYPLGGKLVPTTKKLVFEINGVNHTVYGDDNGYAELELYHPNLTDILGTDGSGTISFKVYGLGRCGYANASTTRTVTVPAKSFNVKFIYPTPSDGQSLSMLFMEVQGEEKDNILAVPKCELWISKDNGYSWVKLKDMDKCYAYIVNEEFDKSNLYYDAVRGQYVLKYKIRVLDTRWGETTETPVRTVYIPTNAEEMPTVNSGQTSESIQATINNAIKNNKPAVLFEPGYYKINLVLDPKGKKIKLLGAGSIWSAYSKGYPVITIKSGDVSIERVNIKDALFNIEVDNGSVSLKDVSVSGGLYGIQIKKGSVYAEDSVFNSKLSGIYAKNMENSTFINTKFFGKVWGAYLIDSNNNTFRNSTFSAKVFGIYLAGSSSNNNILDSSMSATVFGVLIDNGVNNIVSNSVINAKVFGVKESGGNLVRDTVINGIRVFGLYSDRGFREVKNITVYGGVFGAYMKGNATDLVLNNAKLGISVSGQGTLKNLVLDGTNVTIGYSGNLMIMYKKPSKHPSGYTFTGKAVQFLGEGFANLTFNYACSGTCVIYHILGIPSDKPDAFGTSIQVNKTGIYALYTS